KPAGADWLTLTRTPAGAGAVVDFTVSANGTRNARQAKVMLTLDLGGSPDSFTIVQDAPTAAAGAILYDPKTGQEYTASGNGDGTYGYTPNLFTAAFDVLRTGDFDKDAKADLVLYNSHNALAYIGFG